jgi:NAD(P)-dependent dehydrogenase (short-subunit alcohol dehydrogenase family)
MRAMVFTVQPAVQPMGEGGTIMFIGSVAGAMANPAYGTGPASKAATRSYTGTRYTEQAPRRTRVNTLSLGPSIRQVGPG